MKPLHVAIIVVGAALAAGLAVVMTQPPPLPAPAPRPVAAPAPKPVQVPVPVSTPPPVPYYSTAPAITTAPPPVYSPTPTPHVERPAARPKPFPPVAVAKEIPPPPTPVPPPLKPAPYEAPPVTPRRQVVLLPGMQISVRLNQALSSDHAAAGDSFTASLAEPIVADGLVIAERGAHATVHIIDSQRTPKGIELGLNNVQTADGQRVALASEPWTKRETRAGEIVGSILDALGGSGKDAAKPVNIAPQTVIRFRLASSVTITERQL